MQISFYANFSIAFRPNFGGEKSLRGEIASGGNPCPSPYGRKPGNSKLGEVMRVPTILIWLPLADGGNVNALLKEFLCCLKI